MNTLVAQAEMCAADMLAMGGWTDSDVPGALAIVEALLGPRALAWCPPRLLHGAEGELHVCGSTTRIYVAAGLDVRRAAFVALHELTHWWLGRLPDGARTEYLCDLAAAALTCPRRAFRAAMAEHGRHAYAALAADFGCSETLAALRVGECSGTPTSVVAPGGGRIRGTILLLDEHALRRCSPSSPPPGHVVRALGDRPGALVVAVSG